HPTQTSWSARLSAQAAGPASEARDRGQRPCLAACCPTGCRSNFFCWHARSKRQPRVRRTARRPLSPRWRLLPHGAPKGACPKQKNRLNPPLPSARQAEPQAHAKATLPERLRQKTEAQKRKLPNRQVSG